MLFPPAIALAGADAVPSVSFAREIAPILAQKCLTCHGPEKNKGGYRLHTFETMFKPGESKAAPITPGEPARSKIFQLITTRDADDRMPQKDDPLPAAQIALIERWIKEGARFDGPDRQVALSSYAPATPHPDPPATYPRPVAVLALAFTPDGKELAAGGYHEVTFWNPADGSLLRRVKNVAERTQSLAFSPDGRLLAVAGGAPGKSGEVKLFDAASGLPVKTLVSTADLMLALAFSPDGTRLAAGGADNAIRIFNVGSGQLELLIEQHADWVTALAFRADGGQLASASRDKSARLFNTRTGELESAYLGHGEAVFAITIAPDKAQIFSAGRDRKIHQWDIKEAKKAAEIDGFSGEVFQLIAADGQLFSAASDGQVRQHASAGKQAELTRTFTGHQDFVYALAFHAGTKRLASGSYDGEVRVWNVADGKLLAHFPAAPGLVAGRVTVPR